VLWSLDLGDFLIRIRIRPDCISTQKRKMAARFLHPGLSEKVQAVPFTKR